MADFEVPEVDERFCRLLAKAKPVKWGFFHHRHTSTYYRGRAVLVGDSAHASLPFQAAGAAQGLEDALILSSQLAKVAAHEDKYAALGPYIQGALAGYDLVRRPRAQKQLEQAEEVGLLINFKHPEAGDDMSKILPKLQNGRFDWLWFKDLNLDIESAAEEMDRVLSQ